MILIITQAEFEESTNHVIDWLSYYNGNYVRINGADFEMDSEISIELSDGIDNFRILNDQFTISKKSEINVIWYRRWTNKDFFAHIPIPGPSDILSHQIANHLHREFIGVGMAWFSGFEDRIWLNQPASLKRSRNKFETLRKAHSVGLDIPPTLVTNSKKELKRFKSKYKKVITKCASEVAVFRYFEETNTQYTITLTDENIFELPELFFPSLFQARVEKEFEIRVFYLNGAMYSMAIFSQASNQTKDDFRNYNWANPIREVRYKLPDVMEGKLSRLMKEIDLNCGSIDLIFNDSGKYVFLEVNPVGQFGMVSLPCNYFIEEEIAKFLIVHDKQNINL